MIKKYLNFINESKDSDNINAKMQELSDLLKNSTNGSDLMYQWEGDNDNELIVNFVIDDNPIRFEFEIDDLFMMKIVGNKIDFSKKVSSVDEGLSMIEKEIQQLIGVMEDRKTLIKFQDFSKNESKGNTATDKKLWQKALRWVKGTRHGGVASVRHKGETYDSPNDGKGFDVYPSAYSNGAAVKKYNSWGGSWKKNEALDKWFDDDWVRIDTQGNIAGSCGSMPEGKSMQRCLPRKKAESLSKSERKATVTKKIKAGKKGKKSVSNTKKAKVKS
jgi:hypothetical protein